MPAREDVAMLANSEAAVLKLDALSQAEAAAAEEKLLQAQAKKKLKVEAAAAAEKKRLAKLAAKWKEPGPSKLPPLPGMKVRVTHCLGGWLGFRLRPCLACPVAAASPPAALISNP
jgi:hypothetical protein